MKWVRAEGLNCYVRLEAVDLTTKRVSLNLDVQDAQDRLIHATPTLLSLSINCRLGASGS